MKTWLEWSFKLELQVTLHAVYSVWREGKTKHGNRSWYFFTRHWQSSFTSSINSYHRFCEKNVGSILVYTVSHHNGSSCRHCVRLGLVAVASLGGRPAPGVTILGWHHIMMWNHNPTDLWWILFSLCLVPILIWTKNPLIFGEDLFFFGLHVFLDRNRVPPSLATPLVSSIMWAAWLSQNWALFHDVLCGLHQTAYASVQIGEHGLCFYCTIYWYVLWTCDNGNNTVFYSVRIALQCSILLNYSVKLHSKTAIYCNNIALWPCIALDVEVMLSTEMQL